MANPAPTINQINAFNATQGTTIDFNIIGGTELVRSNKIYIYDLSDNSLICTHLYVSTESIHELPANTDSSIVYESGKSSADFVNGAQYYAQIQTYTDTAGTQGGSGLSVAKMFWCLVDPTLTITTIPSTISTTSYNVSATYTDTSASVVSNIIQQYQFNLYSVVGSLLQSSGVVVGSGTQQGTSDAYDISYNFTGLNVGSSYYMTVEVTTTQGMSVSAQSSTFTVSIDTPTLGEATVVNNACDGYISVTSNLSSEYGGSRSGEIVSFETDSENVFTKLQVDLEPIQDLHGYDAPWVGGAGKNKLSNASDTYSIANVTYHDYTCPSLASLSNQTITFSLVTSNMYGKRIALYKGASGSTVIKVGDYGQNYVTATLPDMTGVDTVRIYLQDYTADAVSITGAQLEVGSTPTDWTPYSNICPISGRTEVVTQRTGKNLAIGFSEYNAANVVTTPVYLKAGQYTISFRRGNNLVSAIYIRKGSTFALAEDAYAFKYNTTFMTFNVDADGYYYAQLYRLPTTPTWAEYPVSDIQLELGSTATTYEPYNGQTYTTTLPSTTYGGTLDLVSGELTVDRATVDLGTLSWNYYSAGSTSDKAIFYSPLAGAVGAFNSNVANCMAEKYKTDSVNGVLANVGGIGISKNANPPNVWVSTSSQSDTPSGQLFYELATPQTYQLTPQEIQTLLGQNNVWSEQGEVEVAYNIPITNLLVKRQDVADVSGEWLTLYSQPVTQASDMDFTFIDFINQYGKTYKYALVPLLTQQQSGVEVEVEGGYTVSDEVQSIFDGVFIADSTGSQKCKANVGYGNVDMNQVVGSITPIGAKYPIVITNSQNQYHNGSISGTIVPDDYYFNGNLSRIDMVNKRDELEQFLTNKRAKIIKDWNGNIWLVMIMDNVSCTFNNSYGMGIVNFSTSWVEVGDPTNQQDLQATGLINVGGV